MKSIIPGVLIILSLCSLKTAAQSKQTGGLEEVKKVIAAANAIHFSLFAKHDGSILSLFAEDACLLPANAAALCGREGLLQFFNGAYEAGARDGKFTTLQVYGDGKEYVTEEGTVLVYDGQGKTIESGKYLVVWKKTKSGWKMFRDMFNTNLPAKQ
jgi:ketosteroid isomerase-like protein